MLADRPIIALNLPPVRIIPPSLFPVEWLMQMQANLWDSGDEASMAVARTIQATILAAESEAYRCPN